MPAVAATPAIKWYMATVTEMIDDCDDHFAQMRKGRRLLLEQLTCSVTAKANGIYLNEQYLHTFVHVRSD